MTPTHSSVSRPSWGEGRPGDPGIVVAVPILDEAGGLEAVEQPRDSRWRQHQSVYKIDLAQPVPVGAREV